MKSRRDGMGQRGTCCDAKERAPVQIGLTALAAQSISSYVAERKMYICSAWEFEVRSPSAVGAGVTKCSGRKKRTHPMHPSTRVVRIL